MMDEADTDAKNLARDRGGWSFAAMTLGGVSYTLWHRSHRLGFIAHADLGDRVLAAWGTGELPRAIHHVQLMELPSSDSRFQLSTRHCGHRFVDRRCMIAVASLPKAGSSTS